VRFPLFSQHQSEEQLTVDRFGRQVFPFEPCDVNDGWSELSITLKYYMIIDYQVENKGIIPTKKRSQKL
jgi:hypothetical protein